MFIIMALINLDTSKAMGPDGIATSNCIINDGERESIGKQWIVKF